MQHLLDRYGEKYLNEMRLRLLGPSASDEDWDEYCFSSESPF